MAKWGEGDPRWIVEERPDATNVNNWHWTEKNASQWSKDKLKELLLRVEVDESSIGKCFITEITSMEGEAVANNRKGKLIFFYEWVIKCDWKGCVNGKDEKYSGKLEIPNLSEENSADEVTMDVSVDSTDKEADVLKELMRKQGLKKVQEALSEYIKALRNEFASDMIKPTKLANGGDNSINSFTTDAQEKEKARQHAQEIKRPTTSVPRESLNAGVKIDTSTLKLSENFKCTAEEFYRVLTTQEMLQAFTANKAIVNPLPGGRFELLDGNIQGKFIKLTSPNFIKQEWRIRNWPAEHYSQVTINIEQKEDTTQVDIEQIGVPCLELERTKEGWKRVESCDLKSTLKSEKESCEKLHLQEKIQDFDNIAQISVSAHVDSASNRLSNFEAISLSSPINGKAFSSSVIKTIALPIEQQKQNKFCEYQDLNKNNQNNNKSNDNNFLNSFLSILFGLNDMEQEKARVIEVFSKVGPWSQFFTSFSVPNLSNELLDRVKINLMLYYANYAIIAGILLIYCLITSPTLLIVFGIICVIAYGIISSAKTFQFGSASHPEELTPQKQLLVLICVSIPLFIFLGIHSIFFWLIGASTFVTIVHSVFHNPPITTEEFQSSPTDPPGDIV